MPRTDKTLDAMRANPRDWRIAKLEAVAAAYSVNVRKSRGSHVVFEYPAWRKLYRCQRDGRSSRKTIAASGSSVRRNHCIGASLSAPNERG